MTWSTACEREDTLFIFVSAYTRLLRLRAARAGQGEGGPAIERWNARTAPRAPAVGTALFCAGGARAEGGCAWPRKERAGSGGGGAPSGEDLHHFLRRFYGDPRLVQEVPAAKLEVLALGRVLREEVVDLRASGGGGVRRARTYGRVNRPGA